MGQRLKTTHNHVHRHAMPHPHAFGRYYYPEHEHGHGHQSDRERSFGGDDYVPYHRTHRHTPEQDLGLRRQADASAR